MRNYPELDRERFMNSSLWWEGLHCLHGEGTHKIVRYIESSLNRRFVHPREFTKKLLSHNLMDQTYDSLYRAVRYIRGSLYRMIQL